MWTFPMFLLCKVSLISRELGFLLEKERFSFSLVSSLSC
jgi:hypothetical protein